MSLEIGKMNVLKVGKIAPAGAYLRDGHGEEVLLPNKEVEETLKQGDSIEVFVYRDSQDRLTSTLKKPLGQVGDLAYLKVVDTTAIGAFLDWGLEKDILLPISQQTIRVRKGRSYLVKIYVDKSKRICATMKVEDQLQYTTTLQAGEMVEGVVYGLHPELGAFVAVANQYYGLLHQADIYQEYQIGDKDRFRILKVREDGKIDLSNKKLAYKQMDEDAEKLLQLLKVHNGFLPIHDKSDPRIISKYFGSSKNGFKRALGKLLKEKKVEQVEGSGIRLLK